MNQLNFQVNNNQFACAVVAVSDSKHKRQFITVPTGMGKSRIIAAVIALQHELDSTKNYTIVFISDTLKEAN